MSAFPSGFVPDLRRLRPWPSLDKSLWRSPALVRLTYGALARLVGGCIGPPPSRVLYVGPGVGHIALELARAGHDVTGVDIDEESVALATRAAERDPFREKRGSLSYRVAEFPEEFESHTRYDRVLFSRVLHHIENPAAAVARATELLAPGGAVACVDFAHDRLSASGAHWMARSRLTLSGSGWWPERVSPTLGEEAARVARQWRADHEGEALNPFRAMLDSLRRHLRLRGVAWHPYLFWDLAAEMTTPRDLEGTIARGLRDDEADLLRRGRLRGVLFATSGTVRTP